LGCAPVFRNEKPRSAEGIAGQLFHGPDRLEGVRGDFGNLPVADIEDSEAAAARHEGVTDVPVRLVADERGWVGCLPVLEHQQKSVGRHAAVLLAAPKLAPFPQRPSSRRSSSRAAHA
jgi:hypothetical protein